MTPHQFKEARNSLGLSARQTAELFHVSSGRTIRRWEHVRPDGTHQDIPGPAQILMKLLVSGKISVEDLRD